MSENKTTRLRTSPDWYFVLIGVTLALGLAWGLGYVQAQDSERRNQSAEINQQEISTRVRRECAALSSGKIYRCFNDIRSQVEKPIRDDLEIAIQQRAALSSLVSAIVAGFALVATVIGLFFVRATLVATLKAVERSGEATEEMRKANQISTDNSHRELRAYLSSRSLTVRQAEWDDDKFIVNMTILNSGQTPATMNRVLCTIFWLSGTKLTKLLSYDEPNIYQCHRDTPLNLPWSFDGEFDNYEAEGRLLIVGKLFYTDVFGRKHKDGFGWISPDSEISAFYGIDFPLNLNAYSPETVTEMIKKRKAEATE